MSAGYGRCWWAGAGAAESECPEACAFRQEAVAALNRRRMQLKIFAACLGTVTSQAAVEGMTGALDSICGMPFPTAVPGSQVMTVL